MKAIVTLRNIPVNIIPCTQEAFNLACMDYLHKPQKEDEPDVFLTFKDGNEEISVSTSKKEHLILLEGKNVNFNCLGYGSVTVILVPDKDDEIDPNQEFKSINDDGTINF